MVSSDFFFVRDRACDIYVMVIPLFSFFLFLHSLLVPLFSSSARAFLLVAFSIGGFLCLPEF